MLVRLNHGWEKRRAAQGKGHLFDAKPDLQHDPSGTGPLRRRFWDDFAKRWRNAETQVRGLLITLDPAGDRLGNFSTWFSGIVERLVLDNGRWLAPYVAEAQDMAVARVATLSEKNIQRNIPDAFNPDQPRNPAGSPGGGEWTGQTGTPEFKAWFGDWQDPQAFSSRRPAGRLPVSQVLDDKGRPLVVYHGTKGDISEFQPGIEGANSNTFGSWKTQRAGIFFAEQPHFAEEFATQGGSSAGANVIPAYLRITSPVDLTNGFDNAGVEAIEAKGLSARYYNGIRPSEVWEAFDHENGGEDLVDALKSAGYDGAITQEMGADGESHRVWIAFDPSQVKSAIGNKGTFNPKSPKITDALPPQAFAQAAIDETKGVIAATVQAAARAVHQGQVSCRKAPLITRDVIALMRSIGEARSNLVADHVVMKAYSVASLDAIRALGYTHVGIIPEKVRGTHTHDAGPDDEPRDDRGRWTESMTLETSGPIKAYHGSASEIVGELRPSERGKFGPGVYATMQPSVAALYGKSNEVEIGVKLFNASAWLPTSSRTEFLKILTPEEMKKVTEWWPQGKMLTGEDAWEILRRRLGDERAQEVIKSHGFKGISGIGDGHEYVVFDPKDIKLRTADAARKTPQKRHGRTGQFIAYPKISGRAQTRAERANRRLQAEPDVDVMTAEDDHVCPKCEKISENGPYSINEALSLIPAHPNCRCVFIPAGTLDVEDAFTRGGLHDFNPDEPRNDQGEWTEGGGGQRGGGNPGRVRAPLAGAPTYQGASGPDPGLNDVAEQYAKDHGIDLRRQAVYADLDEARATRIAQAFDQMKHDPNDPAVKAAYADLISQTTDQYRALEKAGYKFYLFDETNDPYAGNPVNAMRDLRANKTMGVFATEAGFGSHSDLDVANNPLLADTGITWPWGSPDGPQKRVLANDLFRAVHDSFGHGLEGAGFRARGEENAWQAHVRLFHGPAIGALTSETRGQNSWLNYGPHGEENRHADAAHTVFADQKTGLMPEWTWTEGRVASE